VNETATTSAPDEAWRVRRRIQVPALRDQRDGTRLRPLLEDIDGVLGVVVDAANRRVTVEYLLTKTDYGALEDVLAAAGFPPAPGRWARVRAAWLRNLDLTGRANAAAPEAACCSRPPRRSGTPHQR
jgi:hypothetical protein